MINDKLHWKRLAQKPYKAGYRNMLNRTFEMPDGQQADFDINADGQTVCVLAFTKDQKVVIAKQFRPAQERVLLELPGGGVEPEETPDEAIQRELLEETGYTGEFHFVSKSLQSAYSTMVRYNFVAIDCYKKQEPNNDDLEHIEVTEMSLEEFRKHLHSGEMTDVATGFLGLDYLKLL